MRAAHLLLCGLLASLAAAAPARAHDCSTWTGTCAFSEVIALGGTAMTRVHAPADLAVAPDGRLAVADMGAYRALVLDGSGAPLFAAGGDDHWVNSVAFGPDGDLYASSDGHIRRYGTDGSLKADITDGLLRGAPGSQRYARMAGLAVDADGRLFAIADEVLMIFGPDGRLEREVTRPTAGGFSRDWVIGAAGRRVLVSNLEAGRVEQIDAAGNVVATVADVPADLWPPASDVDAEGRLHLSGRSEIRTYDQSYAVVATIARELGSGGGAMAAAPGFFVFADGRLDQLTRIDRSGAELPPWGVDPGTGLSGPESVTVAGDGTAIVADTRNRRVVRFRPDGDFDRALRDFGPAGAEKPLAVEMAGDDVYVTYESGLVERVGPDGAVRAGWRVDGTTFLRGVAVAPDGSVWIRNRGSLMRFTPDGALLANLDTQLPFTYASGNGLAVDAAGNLYAALERSIRKLSPTGQVLGEVEAQLAEGVEILPNGILAVAAQRGISLLGPDGKFIASWGDHGTPAGRIFLPFDVAVDDAGRVYVADKLGQKVVRFEFEVPQAGAGGAPLPIAPEAPLRLVVPRSGLAVARSGSVVIRLACRAGGGRCRGDLRLARRSSAARRAVRAPALLARGRFDVPAGRTRAVRIRLRASARLALRSAGRLRANALATTRGGARVRRAVTLRPKR